MNLHVFQVRNVIYHHIRVGNECTVVFDMDNFVNATEMFASKYGSSIYSGRVGSIPGELVSFISFA